MYFPQRLHSAETPVPSSECVVRYRCHPNMQRKSFMVSSKGGGTRPVFCQVRLT